MKAMIFAAGIGSRLKPFTDTKPKALLPVQGKPLLQHNLEKLIQFGVNDFVINVHHFADQIVDFLKKNDNFKVNIQISDESDKLLDTGGGLENAKQFLKGDESIILQNADVITNINYANMLQIHDKSESLATLAVKSRETTRYLRFNYNNELCGWENTKTGEEIVARKEMEFNKFAFSGVHIISNKFINHLDKQGVYSIIEVYLELAKNNKITCYQHNNDYWFDVGTPEKVAALKIFLDSN